LLRSWHFLRFFLVRPDRTLRAALRLISSRGLGSVLYRSHLPYRLLKRTLEEACAEFAERDGESDKSGSYRTSQDADDVYAADLTPIIRGAMWLIQVGKM
jgi:hypothetical protein